MTAKAMPDEVIVSDDSEDPESTRALCMEFELVKYVRGPKRGFCANRNVAIKACSSDYIALLDDDAIVSTTFVSMGRAIVASAPPATAFTGNLIEGETRCGAPPAPTFLGHFGTTPPDERKTIRSIHSNCNLFPRSVFNVVHFDEAIVYGYEELDLGAQLLAAGYRIEHRPQLLNEHKPPHRSEAELEFLDDQATRSRFYAVLKRHLIWQRNLLAVPAYLVLASVHDAVHRIRSGRGKSSLKAFADMWWAFRKAIREARRQRARNPKLRVTIVSVEGWPTRTGPDNTLRSPRSRSWRRRRRSGH